MLTEVTPAGMHAVFERFRGILHDGSIDKRVQYTIEALFAVRKVKFADYPAVLPELDLVEREDQITHEVRLLSASGVCRFGVLGAPRDRARWQFPVFYCALA